MMTVAVVDDHAIVRDGIARLVDAEEDLEVVAILTDGATAADLLGATHVDVILMDLSMDGVDGVEATRRIVSADPGARIVILAASADPEQVMAAFDAGAVGFLLKDSESSLLLDGVRAATRDESPIDPRIARMLVDDRHDRLGRVRLSKRRTEILQLASDGLLNKQIARTLGITENTVKAHLTRVYERLGVTGRAEAIETALDLEIIQQHNGAGAPDDPR
ncbi:MAG TPA: response regulator transcription factor [Ilumatobacteraceae bacterium]|nr:response regulator transcription factor [Ilumatobacteraceae bacterium]